MLRQFMAPKSFNAAVVRLRLPEGPPVRGQRLSGRSWFSQQTFAETRGNGQHAPIPVIAGDGGGWRL
jgi:hypothetical protein